MGSPCRYFNSAADCSLGWRPALPHFLGLQGATQLATIGHLRLTNSRYTRAVQSRTSKAANKSTAMRIA
jgi:hypothetical protein